MRARGAALVLRHDRARRPCSHPGQILTGSLQAGRQTGAPVTTVGALADFSGDSIIDFAAQDLIDVTNVGSSRATLAYTGTATSGMPTIGAASASTTLHLSGDLAGDVFHAVPTSMEVPS